MIAQFDEGAVQIPAKTKAYEALAQLERQHPTFRLNTKRNRDIAGRPREAFGRLRPTRPGEYLLMDTTRLDVFALDPVTLRELRAHNGLVHALHRWDPPKAGLEEVGGLGPPLTTAELAALDPSALERHNQDRRRFLAALRPIKTAQAETLSADLAATAGRAREQPVAVEDVAGARPASGLGGDVADEVVGVGLVAGPSLSMTPGTAAARPGISRIDPPAFTAVAAAPPELPTQRGGRCVARRRRALLRSRWEWPPGHGPRPPGG